MTASGLSIIETVYEYYAPDHIYRLYETKAGVRIKRTSNDDQLWGHSTLTQCYSGPTWRFVGQLHVDQPFYFPSLLAALEMVKDAVANRY